MAFEFPYRSILTTAPKLNIQILPSLGKFKKLYSVLLCFIVFADLTFAAEERVERGKEFADRFFNPGAKLQSGDTNSEGPVTKIEYGGKELIDGGDKWCFIVRNPHGGFTSVECEPKSILGEDLLEPPPPPPPPPPPKQREIDYTKVYGNKTLSHEQRIIEAIAQEFFFHDNEVNFYKSRSWEWFTKWAAENEADFKEEKKSRPDLQIINYFAEKTLGWEDLYCDGIECHNLPTSDHVRQHFRFERNEARHVLNTLKSLAKAYREVHQYSHILGNVKNDLDGHCKDFSEIFFHGPTKGKQWTCETGNLELFLLIALVITVLVTTLVAVEAMPVIAGMIASVFGPAPVPAGVSVIFGTGGLGGEMTIEALSTITPLHLNELWAVGALPFPLGKRQRVDPWKYQTAEKYINAVYDDLADKALSWIYPPAENRYTNIYVSLNTGSFGLAEGFNATDLRANQDGSSVYDQVDVKAGWMFRRYPLINARTKPSNLHEEVRPAKNRVVTRLAKIFDIHHRIESDQWYNGFPDRPDVNLMLRLVNEDKTPMNIHQALDFLERHSLTINKRWHQLREGDSECESEYLPLVIPRSQFPTPKILINHVKDYTPWSSILAGLKFEGAKPVKKNPQLQWRATSTMGSKYQKRGLGPSFDPSAHILHEMYGNLESLEALKVIAPLNNGISKRASERWAVNRERDGDDDLFTVDFQSHYFENKIHHEDCGTDNYEHNERANELACKKFLEDVVGEVTGRVSGSYEDANVELSALARYNSKRFSTYPMWHNVELLYSKAPEVNEKLFQNLKNTLVSKAYTDGNCFVRCGKDRSYHDGRYGPFVEYDDKVACQTVCYDPIKDKFEQLYGFDGLAVSDSSGPAQRPPWSFSERDMNKNAYHAYNHREEYGYYPESTDLNPYVPLVEDLSPVLPVCYSDLPWITKEGLPCSCGNKYGDMTAAFANIVNLKSSGNQNSEWSAITSCLNRMKGLAVYMPAAYLLNSCHVIYTIIAPPGTGSQQEKHDWGHYRHNLQGCNIYWQTYERNKHLSDEDMNVMMCMLWAQHATDFNRGWDHSHPDFSYVNDKLQDHGCHGYLG